MIDSFKKLLFPKKCLGCNAWGSYLCPDCVNYIKTIDNPICPSCDKPSTGGFTHPVCKKPLSLDGLTSIFEYKGIVKRAIIKLKYCFVQDLADTLLELFLSFAGEDKTFCKLVKRESVLLVPVPLFWMRKNWRGFNQSELLGEIVADKLGVDFVPGLLIRTKKTKEQRKLNKKQRQKNIRGAFAINQSSAISHQPSVIIFDDVWTTGATLKECAKVLKRNGFNKVWGLTLAAKV